MGNAKEIKLSDLKLGDVVIFEIGTAFNWLSDGIALLTNSTVSHAAMVYRDDVKYPGKMMVIEEGSKGLSTAVLDDRMAEHGIHIMRNEGLTEEDIDKLMQTADGYLREKTAYSYADIALMTISILSSAMPFSSKRQELIGGDKALQYGVYAIAVLAGIVCHGSKGKMVCSQFVHRCYKETNENTKIIYSSQYNSTSLLSRIKKYVEDNNLTLKEDALLFQGFGELDVPDNVEHIDPLLVADHINNWCKVQNIPLEFDEALNPNIDQLNEYMEVNLRGLIGEVKQSNQLNKGLLGKGYEEQFNDDFISFINNICCIYLTVDTLMGLFDGHKNKVYKAMVEINYIEKMLELLNDMPTPADLLRESENLNYMGMLVE